MRYLVTGGAGFIGSHLCEVLLRRGDDVVVLDDLSTGNARNLAHLEGHPSLEIVRGSILDEDQMRGAAARADVIVHLAAAVGVKLIVERPLESLLVNIRGTEIVLEAAAGSGATTLVASTSEIYGKNASRAVAEDADQILGSPFKTRWSYATAKTVDEILTNAYWRDRGLPAIVVRLFNCVGPRQTGAFGMVVPRLVRQALAGEDVTVFGDGRQRRCFCHVRDTVGGLIALLDHPDAIGDVFNVGARNEITMTELAETIVRRTGSSSAIVHVPYDEAYERGFEDVERRVPDITKIATLTGWRPTRTLDDILDDVIAYERETAGVRGSG
jgi:nucleoside-diphosphate-sugar epimerase